ncbi:MAG: hypothetical protein IKL53_01690 [Lachnospiraceae bacterium]|nr:hypothetical protein [Lachnospiraceae bacterium]
MKVQYDEIIEQVKKNYAFAKKMLVITIRNIIVTIILTVIGLVHAGKADVVIADMLYLMIALCLLYHYCTNLPLAINDCRAHRIFIKSKGVGFEEIDLPYYGCPCKDEEEDCSLGGDDNG